MKSPTSLLRVFMLPTEAPAAADAQDEWAVRVDVEAESVAVARVGAHDVRK